MEFGPGDVGYVPQGFGHYIENIGDEDCRAVLVFNSPVYEEISLTGWLAASPPKLLATNFGVPEEVFARFPKDKEFITVKKT